MANEYHNCTDAERKEMLKKANEASGSEAGRMVKKAPSGFLSSAADSLLGTGGLIGDLNSARNDVNEVKGASGQLSIAAMNPNSQCDEHGQLVAPSTPKEKGFFDSINPFSK